jgi:hypothetical protein
MEAATAPPAPVDERDVAHDGAEPPTRPEEDVEATAAAKAEADEHVEGPPAESSSQEAVSADSNRETGLRSYVVLEEQNLGELVRSLLTPEEADDNDSLLRQLEDLTVLHNLGTYASKNTEHALRQAAKQAYDEAEHATPTLIPVSETYWRPHKLTVKNERTVTFG